MPSIIVQGQYIPSIINSCTRTMHAIDYSKYVSAERLDAHEIEDIEEKDFLVNFNALKNLKK